MLYVEMSGLGGDWSEGDWSEGDESAMANGSSRCSG